MTMIIRVRERGPVPRRLRKVYTEASKVSWVAAGTWWHVNRRDLRFSVSHGMKAGYEKRKGEQSGMSRRGFFASYTGRKLRRWGHRRPLEFSGETRRLVRTASITSTSNSTRVAYPGARKFNFRNPRSTIRMADEFRRLTSDEPKMIAAEYDKALSTNLNKDKTETARS